MTSIRALIPALLLIAGAACSASGGGDTVTIGFTGPLSGGAALYGRNVLDGIEMAVADINDAGGLAIAGRKVKVAVAPLDERYFPNESATNAKRLVHQYGSPVVFCPHSGGILAMVGGSRFKDFKYGLNHVTQIPRQVGPAFKPFVFTVAADNNYPPCSELLNQPVTLMMADGRRWSPSNTDGSFGGMSTLREGLRKSINLVAVRAINGSRAQLTTSRPRSRGPPRFAPALGG